MRSSFVATLLVFVGMPLVGVHAQQRYVHPSVASGCSCGCGAPVPAPVPVAAPCTTCSACSTCNTYDVCGSGVGYGGCGSCGGGLCANPALFYQTLYAEFHARNPWYLEHKARESAARRARLYGKDPELDPVAPIAKPAPNRVAEPVKAP